MSTLSYLKITQPGWDGYTGNIAMIDFVDGMSTIPVPQILADRVAMSITVTAVDEEGNELGPVGVTQRLADRNNTESIPPGRETFAATEAEINRENARLAALASKKDAIFYTRAELEGIADLKGIKGLREIASYWGVHERSIGRLIELILKAQDDLRMEIRIVRDGEKPEPDLFSRSTKPTEPDAMANIGDYPDFSRE